MHDTPCSRTCLRLPAWASCFAGIFSPCGRTQWLIGEIAGIMAGGVAAGIYPTDMPDQVVFKAKHSSASIAVVENEAKLKVFVDNKAQLPKLKAVIDPKGIMNPGKVL